MIKRFAFLLLFSQTAFSQNHTLVVNAAKPGATIQPTMWGVFFEDINFGADGGIYAELVKNRSFEFYRPLMGWREIKPANSKDAIQFWIRGKNAPNPRYARFFVRSATGYGISNEGFRGMGIKANSEYEFTVWTRAIEGVNTKLRIELADSKNIKIVEASVPINAAGWVKRAVSFTTTGGDPKSKLNLF